MNSSNKPPQLRGMTPAEINPLLQPEQRNKPDCPLIGRDGNIFSLAGVASRTLKNNSLKEQAAEMQGRILKSRDYHEALRVIDEYVNITAVGEGLDQDEEMYPHSSLGQQF